MRQQGKVHVTKTQKTPGNGEKTDGEQEGGKTERLEKDIAQVSTKASAEVGDRLRLDIIVHRRIATVVTEEGQCQIDTERPEENPGDLLVQGILKDGGGGGGLCFFSHAGRLAECSWLKDGRGWSSKIFMP